MITTTGFSRPTLAEIEADIKDKFKTKFSETIDGVTYAPSLEPESFLGALASVMAAMKDDLYQDEEDAYYANYLTTANGVQLDRAAVPTERKPATFASAPVTFVGTPDTVISAGFIVETEDKRRYALTATVILDAYGLGAGTCLAQVAGIAGNAPEGGLSFMPTPLDGLVSCSNLLPAEGGEDIESDAALRERALDERANGLTSSLDAIVARVKAVADVTDAFGVENLTQDFVDIIPPGGFKITVRGGLSQAIGEAIFAARPAGNPSAGSESVTVYDINSNPVIEKFSRVTDVPIFVAVTLNVNSLYNPTLSNDVVRQQILNYIGGVNPDSVTSRGVDIGEKVYAWKCKATLFDFNNPGRFPGLVDATVLIGTATGSRIYSEITIANDSEAITDFTDIAITVVVS